MDWSADIADPKIISPLSFLSLQTPGNSIEVNLIM